MKDRAVYNYLAVLLIGLLVGGIAVWLVYNPMYIAERGAAEELRSKLAALNETNRVLVERVKALESENGALRSRLEEALHNASLLAARSEELEMELESARLKIRELLSTSSAVRVLPDRDYFYEVKQLIEDANESVHVAVFAVKYDTSEGVYSDPVDNLLRELVRAKKRGVDVRVVVDDVTYREFYDTIKYLKENGVPVRLDPSPDRTMHVKIVIVDGKIAVVGSHNWTEAALRWNYEYSLEVTGYRVADKVERYFENLWDNGRQV